MKIVTKLAFLSSTLFCLICRLMAADQSGLEITVVMSGGERQVDRIRDDFAQGEGHIRYDFIVSLRNTGTQPLTVLKGSGRDLGSLATTTQNGETTHQMLCGWGFHEFDVPSESELGLVRLQSGETAKIHLAIRTNEEIDHAKTTFVYLVEEKLAARFGTWGGKQEVAVLSPQEMLLLRDKRQREQR